MYTELSNGQASLLAPCCYSYSDLKPEEQYTVQQRTNEIKSLISRTAQNLIEIGEKLYEVKAIVGHGNFGNWLKAEFNWSVAIATKMMQASRQFKNVNFTNLNFSPSAIYLLAAPSTPDLARTEALSRAEQGQSITYSLAKKLVAHYKESKESKERSKNNLLEIVSLVNETEVKTTEVEFLETTDKLKLSKQLIFDTGIKSHFNHIVQLGFFKEYLGIEWLKSIREQQELSLIICVIDNYNFPEHDFSKITGNTCVNKVAEVIQQTIKRPTDIFSYYGQGKFIIMLSHTEKSGAIQVAENIRQAVKNEKIKLVDHNNNSTNSVSVGLVVSSLVPSEQISLDRVLISLLDHSPSDF